MGKHQYQPCMLCGSKKFRKTGADLFCSNGHRVCEYEERISKEKGFSSGNNETDEARRPKESLKRKQKHRVTSERAYEIFQYALRIKSRLFRESKKLPVDFETSVMNIWLLYCSRTSLKLQKERRKTTNRNIKQGISQWKVQPKNLEKMATLKSAYFLCFIYLGCRELRLPYFLSDIVRSAEIGEIPYLGCYKMLPKDLLPTNLDKISLNGTLGLQPVMPALKDLRDSVDLLQQFFRYEYDIDFPPENFPLLSIELTKRLYLPPELHVLSCAIYDLQNCLIRSRVDFENVELVLCASLGVALKLYCNTSRPFIQDETEPPNPSPKLVDVFKRHLESQVRESGLRSKYIRELDHQYSSSLASFANFCEKTMFPNHANGNILAEHLRDSSAEKSSIPKMQERLLQTHTVGSKSFLESDFTAYPYLIEKYLNGSDFSGATPTDHAIIATELARIGMEIAKCEKSIVDIIPILC
ncbi:hypothetical protein BC829DRAFT_408014 [Chytridium lagenaria]|nr:hypothetical protein BC829DRAFT_408014 [Chytridium lagenaria]